MRRGAVVAQALALALLASAAGGASAVAAKAPPARLVVTSADLPAGRPFPMRHVGREFGCTGEGVSPALAWGRAPAGTKSFFVTMYDPYRPPQAGWWHWLVTDIPAHVHALPRGAGNDAARLPAPARMAKPDGDAPEPRYYGPCPDTGDPAHRYVITVFALDVAHLDVPATATPSDVDYTAYGHVLAKGELVRSYRR